MQDWNFRAIIALVPDSVKRRVLSGSVRFCRVRMVYDPFESD